MSQQVMRRGREFRVRVRRVERAADGPAVLSVYCPSKLHSVPLSECLSCSDCVGMSLDQADEQGFLRCTAAPVSQSLDSVEAPGPVDAELTPVSQIMPSKVICVHPELDLESLTTLFLERGISGAPVVDNEGRPLGVISKTDLVRHQHERDRNREVDFMELESSSYELEPGFHVEPVDTIRVGDIMTPLAFTLTESCTVAKAAALMAFEGVHRVPVVGIDGAVVGVISTLDVLRWLARRSGYLLPPA